MSVGTPSDTPSTPGAVGAQTPVPAGSFGPQASVAAKVLAKRRNVMFMNCTCLPK